MGGLRANVIAISITCVGQERFGFWAHAGFALFLLLLTTTAGFGGWTGLMDEIRFFMFFAQIMYKVLHIGKGYDILDNWKVCFGLLFWRG